MSSDTGTDTRFPRVTIQFCTQCKWNLRAAYFAQELLQTFSTSLGEISLQPSTGGVFKVDIYHHQHQTATATAAEQEQQLETKTEIKRTPLWDRSTDGGFPETKELKRRVRDVIDPGRGLGHVDRDYHPKLQQKKETQPAAAAAAAAAGGAEQSEKKTETGTGEPAAEAVVAGQTPAAEGKPHQQVPSSKAEEEEGKEKEERLPRPRDILSRAAPPVELTYEDPSKAPEVPKQREWGSRESDRTVPGGGRVVGGTKPTLQEKEAEGEGEGQGPRTRPAEKDENMKVADGEVAGRGDEGGGGGGESGSGGRRQSCEDCG